MIRWILSIFGFLFSFVTTGLVMAAITVGGVLWMYARDLPNYTQLAQYAPPTISRVYSAEGHFMDEFARERRIFVPSGSIPALVKDAFISAEDKNFYSHHGYDARGMVSALIDAVKSRGRRVRGASTITQQVMKNFLLSGDRTGERKIKEIILATRLEKVLSKEQILELYLNEIFLGQNSYGVAAAAQTYFNKTLEELSPAEAAYLAALPKAPSSYHPVRQTARAVARRNFVLREMFQNGYIDRAAYEEATASPLITVQGGQIESFRAAMPARDYFTDEIRRQLSETYSEEEFFTGGLSIRATMDPALQQAAARALRDGLESYDRAQGVWRGAAAHLDEAALVDWRAGLAGLRLARDITGWSVAVVLELKGGGARIGVEGEDGVGAGDGDGSGRIPADDVTWARPLGDDGKPGAKAKRVSDLLEVGDVVYVRPVIGDDGARTHWSLRQVPELQGGFMAMDVHTGRVLAMQGGFSYQSSVFNRVTQAARQPGSSFKPFVYAAALDSGYAPNTIVIDAPIEVETEEGIWRPQNHSLKFYGPTPLRTGIERSRNLMTIRLARDVGMRTVAEYAVRFGIYSRMYEFLANSLGSQVTSLFKLVVGYAMFANGGERVEPTLVDRVQDRYGRTIYRHDRRRCLNCTSPVLTEGAPPRLMSLRRRVIDAVTAYQITSMMVGVVERGTAAGRVNTGVPTAGKTGTTNDARDVWFIGYTSNIVAGCYMGFDIPRGMGAHAYGGSMCAPVFDAFMKTAVARYGGGPFKVPEGGVFVNIDRVSGERLPDDAEGPEVVAELFREGEEPVSGFLNIVDGGFAMSSDLPVFSPEEAIEVMPEPAIQEVITSTGERRAIPKDNASFGSLSSGGMY